MAERPVPDQSGSLYVADDDVHIHWDRFGTGERETVVFLNGIGMLTESWFTSVPRLLPDYDVLLYDYPGQGKSSCEDKPYYLDHIADYLAMIMDELEIDRVHTVGVSYGGFVAAEFGRRHPDRLHTQTLSGILLSRELTFDMYQDISMQFYAGGPELFDLYTRFMYEKTFGERFLRQIGPKIEKLRLKFWENYKDRTRSLARLTQAQDPFFEQIEINQAGYRRVTAPTLILAGEHDKVVPVWMQEKLAELYPESRLLVLPDCAHITYLERPELFWPALLEFIGGKRVAFDAPGLLEPSATRAPGSRPVQHAAIA